MDISEQSKQSLNFTNLTKKVTAIKHYLLIKVIYKNIVGESIESTKLNVRLLFISELSDSSHVLVKTKPKQTIQHDQQNKIFLTFIKRLKQQDLVRLFKIC